MSNDINLVNKTTSEGSKEIRLKKIRVISFSALIIVAIFSILIFLINLRFSVNYVVNQQNKLVEKLTAYDETKSKITTLNKHLSDINLILESRKKYNEVASKIIKNDTAPSMVYDEFNVKDGTINISVSSSTLQDFDKFLNHMVDLNKKKTLKSVTLESLTFEENSAVFKMSILAN